MKSDDRAPVHAKSSDRGWFSRAWAVMAVFVSLAALASGQDATSSDQASGRSAPRRDEQCLVCGAFSPPDTILTYRGRRVTISGAMCLAAWRADPARFFARLQGRGALVDEQQINVDNRLKYTWFLGGLYVLLGLVCGALAACRAVAQGRRPVGWFALGMTVNVLALAALVFVTRREDERGRVKLVAGTPRGLAKFPSTHAPASCPRCGADQHPSAAVCGGCGALLAPAVDSEIARLGRVDR